MCCPYHASTMLMAQVSPEEVSQQGKIGPSPLVWTPLLTISRHPRESWAGKKRIARVLSWKHFLTWFLIAGRKT